MKKVMKALAAIMLMTAVVFAAGCTKSDEPNNGGDNNGGNNGGGNQSNHEYVDLGLPSGTLWATCNVGATTPYEYGDYFAWGETERKEVYEWSTYKWCRCNNDDYPQLTKYCNTDNLTILQSGDDAATVNWGNGWRTPNKAQWQELKDNTTSAWTTQNDVYGRVFYGNGQSLFLPAAGRWDSELYHAGSFGNYWSNLLGTGTPGGSHYAWLFGFSDDCYMSSNYRSYGLSVRAVREN